MASALRPLSQLLVVLVVFVLGIGYGRRARLDLADDRLPSARPAGFCGVAGVSCAPESVLVSLSFSSVAPRKTAVCISGHRMDYLERTWPGRDGMGSKLAAANDADVFLYGLFTNRTRMLRVASLMASEGRLRSAVLLLKTATKDASFGPPYRRLPRNLKYQARQVAGCNSLVESFGFLRDHSYSTVVRARPDLVFRAAVDLRLYPDPDRLYIPPPHNAIWRGDRDRTVDKGGLQQPDSGGCVIAWKHEPRPGGVSDAMAFGSPWVMTRFSSLAWGRLLAPHESRDEFPEGVLMDSIAEMLPKCANANATTRFDLDRLEWEAEGSWLSTLAQLMPAGA